MNSIKKIGRVTIYDDEYVVKPERDMSDLEHYFISRDFHNYLPVIERIGDKNKYKYLTSYNIHDDQLGVDIAGILGILHNKTSLNKEVNLDKKKSIYDDLIGYINFTEECYLNLLSSIEYKEFPSPSETIFLNNFSKINEAISFVKGEADTWFNMVKNKKKERICFIHGNPSLDHAIANESLYLINWGYSRFESPVMDIIKYYENTWNKLDFSSVLDEYFRVCTLTEDEKKLLFINISIPKIIEFGDYELENVKLVRNVVDYVYKTEKLIGPYYTIENEE